MVEEPVPSLSICHRKRRRPASTGWALKGRTCADIAEREAGAGRLLPMCDAI